MHTLQQTAHDPRLYRRPSIPVAYLQLMVEILGERGIGPAVLLQGLPVDGALLEQPLARLSPQQWGMVVLRALDLTGDPGLGIEYGLRMRPTVHGVLGYAAMSSTSLRQALELSVRYFRVRQTEFEFRFVEDGLRGRLELRERIPIRVARSFFVENILLGVLRGIAVLLGRELRALTNVEIAFDWPCPPYFAPWRKRLPTVRFEQPCNAVSLALSDLQLRPVLADPQASRQAVELCERELALVADREASIIPRVRAELVLERAGGYPRLDELARRLHLSDRSLKRRLQSQGTSFLLLLEEARLRDARQLLSHSALGVQEVSERLGYRNPANFSRAFQRWTGQSPSAWRATGGA